MSTDTNSNAFREELDLAVAEAHHTVDALVEKFEKYLATRVAELTPETTVVPPVVEPPTAPAVPETPAESVTPVEQPPAAPVEVAPVPEPTPEVTTPTEDESTEPADADEVTSTPTL